MSDSDLSDIVLRSTENIAAGSEPDITKSIPGTAPTSQSTPQAVTGSKVDLYRSSSHSVHQSSGAVSLAKSIERALSFKGGKSPLRHNTSPALKPSQLNNGSNGSGLSGVNGSLNQSNRSKNSVTTSQTINNISVRSSTSFLNMDDPLTKSILQYSAPHMKALGQRTQLEDRRLKAMERTIAQMTESNVGVSIKTRTKAFKSYPLCALGNDIVCWLMQHCDFLYRWEAVRYATQMLEAGYLIHAEVLPHQDPKFRDDSTYYSFQNSYFWPTKNWAPSDLDYSVFLIRKMGPKMSTDLLHHQERERLDKLKITLAAQWNIIMEGVERHRNILKQMSNDERKVFSMREAAFWECHRPLGARSTFAEIEERNKSLERNHMVDSEYEATLTRNQLLDHLEKRLYTLQVTFATNRLKTSAASKSMINRCEAWRPLDCFLTPSVQNPYRIEVSAAKEESFSPPRSKAKPEEIRVWCQSLFNLLSDPLGTATFMSFLEQEFSSENLKFYMECKRLDNEYSRREWVLMAREIYKKFLAPTAPMEINVDDQLRKSVREAFAKFEHVEDAKIKGMEVDVYVFADVVQHIYALMEKDSYARFILNTMRS